MKIECLKIDAITADFDQLIDFAGYCGMEEDVGIVVSREEIEGKLKKLNLKHEMHFCNSEEMRTRWGRDSLGLCIPRLSNSGLTVQWHIVVVVQEGSDPPVNVLTHELGHYAEQIASGVGWARGVYAFRGTSFDEACRYIAQLNGTSKSDPSVRVVADELVATLNGAWFCWASGIDPMVAAAEMLAISTPDAMRMLRVAIQRDALPLATAITSYGFYRDNIANIGWKSEPEMCKLMDAATTKLLKQLRKGAGKTMAV